SGSSCFELFDLGNCCGRRGGDILKRIPSWVKNKANFDNSPREFLHGGSGGFVLSLFIPSLKTNSLIEAAGLW
ncbi:hypothetical protein VP01_3229g3, partial [Puccinia sorghi]